MIGRVAGLTQSRDTDINEYSVHTTSSIGSSNAGIAAVIESAGRYWVVVGIATSSVNGLQPRLSLLQIRESIEFCVLVVREDSLQLTSSQ